MSYVRKTASEVLASIQAVFVSVFGTSVTTSPSSTVGLLTQELADIGVETEDTRALLLSNVYDPNVASERYLDGLCALHQIVRAPASFSTVTCSVTGLSGVVIGAGEGVILGSDGTQFVNQDAITITAGVGTGVFVAETAGAISVLANTVNRISTAIAGWDTVNNPSDGTIGGIKESDNSLRLKRKKALYYNSAGTLRSIIGALELNSNVIDYNIYENYSNDTITIPANINPKSLYLVVHLTDSVSESKLDEIAEILYLKKSGGCGMMGTLHTYVDPDYTWVSYPTYFDIAIERAIEMNINVNTSSSVTEDTADAIRTAIIASFLGEDGQDPVEMGVSFSVGRFYPAIINQGVYDVNSFTMNIIGESPGSSITTDFTDIATLSADDIYITIVE